MGVVLPEAHPDIYFQSHLVTPRLLWAGVIWAFGITPFLLSRALRHYLPLVTTKVQPQK